MHNKLTRPGTGTSWSLLEVNQTIMSDGQTDPQTDGHIILSRPKTVPARR